MEGRTGSARQRSAHYVSKFLTRLGGDKGGGESRVGEGVNAQPPKSAVLNFRGSKERGDRRERRKKAFLPRASRGSRGEESESSLRLKDGNKRVRSCQIKTLFKMLPATASVEKGQAL